MELREEEVKTFPDTKMVEYELVEDGEVVESHILHFTHNQIETGVYKRHAMNAFGKEVDSKDMVPDLETE